MDGSEVALSGGRIVKVTPDPVVQFMKSYFHFVGSELASRFDEPLPKSAHTRPVPLPTPVTLADVSVRQLPGLASGFAVMLRLAQLDHGDRTDRKAEPAVDLHHPDRGRSRRWAAGHPRCG